MNSEFEILDGQVIEQDIHQYRNRAFRYGDGVFETIKISNGKPLYFNDHYTRLENGIKSLKLLHPHSLSVELLESAIQKLCSRNNMQHAKARLTLYRNSAGTYTPDDHMASWHLTLTSLDSAFYNTNEISYSAGLYRDEAKTMSSLSNIKTLNCLVYVLASIYAKESGWNDALITNTNGSPIEATSSNVFFKINDQIITPPLSDGCLEGVMRKQVIDLLSDSEYQLTEKSVSESDLNRFDEIFITNTINGARNITEINARKLKTGIAGKINQTLNEKFVLS